MLLPHTENVTISVRALVFVAPCYVYIYAFQFVGALALFSFLFAQYISFLHIYLHGYSFT